MMGAHECKAGNETPALLLVVGRFPSRKFQVLDSRAPVRLEFRGESVKTCDGEPCFSSLRFIFQPL